MEARDAQRREQSQATKSKAVEAVRQAERLASQWQKRAEQAETTKEEIKDCLLNCLLRWPNFGDGTKECEKQLSGVGVRFLLTCLCRFCDNLMLAPGEGSRRGSAFEAGGGKPRNSKGVPLDLKHLGVPSLPPSQSRKHVQYFVCFVADTFSSFQFVLILGLWSIRWALGREARDMEQELHKAQECLESLHFFVAPWFALTEDVATFLGWSLRGDLAWEDSQGRSPRSGVGERRDTGLRFMYVLGRLKDVNRYETYW